MGVNFDYPEIIENFIKLAKLDIDCSDETGRTPIDDALDHRSLEAAMTLFGHIGKTSMTVPLIAKCRCQHHVEERELVFRYLEAARRNGLSFEEINEFVASLDQGFFKSPTVRLIEQYMKLNNA